MPTTISIALATYNGAKFINEQLASLAAQTRRPLEIVVSDDGSTDNTLDLISAFAATAPFPIHIERNTGKLGYRENFMKAARACRGEVIAFCDQDDVWLPQKLAACGALFDENPDMRFAYHNATVVDGALQPIGRMDDRAAPQRLNPPLTRDPWQYGLGFTQLLRRELLDYGALWPRSVDFFDPSNPEAHDQWFSFLGSCLGTTGYIDEPQVLYRRHGGNTTTWGRRHRLDLLDRLKNLFYTRAAGLEVRALSAERRASILESIAAAPGDPARQELARRAAEGWRQLEAGYRLRLEIYGGADIRRRAQGLAAALDRGIYASRGAWGVGKKALVRDILRGVLFPVPDAGAEPKQPIRESA